MVKQKSHLRAFWPIQGTPYVFCELQKSYRVNSSPAQTRFSNLVIDVRAGKCVLRIDWQNLNPRLNSGSQSSRTTEYKGLLLDRDQFSLIYEQIFRYDSSQFQRMKDSKAKKNATFRKKKDLWRIDLSGEAKKLENAPDFFIQNQSSYRCLNFSNLISVSTNRLRQYQLTDEGLQQCGGWDEIGDSLMQLCGLPNRGFLFSNTRKGMVVFLLPDEPKVRRFAIKTLFADLPAPPRDITPWEQLSSLSWQLVPLSIRRGSSILAYFQMPGFPIFEIHMDRLSDGKTNEVFSFLGFSPTCRPFVSMHDNQTILFTNSLVRRGNDLSTGVPIFALEKGKKGWPTEYGFVFQPESIPLPASIQRICEIPIDDEYLLAYGHDSFWAVRADGGVVKPVYPRSGPYRRRR